MFGGYVVCCQCNGRDAEDIVVVAVEVELAVVVVVMVVIMKVAIVW